MELLEGERHLARVKKLLALAASTVNPHESAAAASRVADYLTAHPLPVRWLVRAGTVVLVVPVGDLGSRERAKASRRAVPAPKDVLLAETHRVKDVGQTRDALSCGHLYFERHGYVLLVPVGGVDAFF